jgi:hypothetical protein
VSSPSAPSAAWMSVVPRQFRCTLDKTGIRRLSRSAACAHSPSQATTAAHDMGQASRARSGVGSSGAAASRTRVVTLHRRSGSVHPAGLTTAADSRVPTRIPSPSLAALLDRFYHQMSWAWSLSGIADFHITAPQLRSCPQTMRSYLWVRTPVAGPLQRTRSVVLASRRCPPSQPPLPWPVRRRLGQVSRGPTGGRDVASLEMNGLAYNRIVCPVGSAQDVRQEQATGMI